MSEGAGASRRRHTRWPRDWSSDVCSSDLPLLVSVRSGAVYSMPGMMDTVLNLGLNDETVKGIAKLTNNSRFAYDCYRRFIQMFSDVVLGVDLFFFENYLEKLKEEKDYEADTDL